MWYQQRRDKRRKPQRKFQYEVAWNKKDVKDVIKQVWRVNDRSHRGWDPILGKLEKSRNSLLRWKKLNMEPTETNIHETMAKVKDLHAGKGNGICHVLNSSKQKPRTRWNRWT
jgi:hypothetical protein